MLFAIALESEEFAKGISRERGVAVVAVQREPSRGARGERELARQYVVRFARELALSMFGVALHHARTAVLGDGWVESREHGGRDARRRLRAQEDYGHRYCDDFLASAVTARRARVDKYACEL